MCAWPRVDQSLSRYGYASRRQGAEWVRSGRVRLAGGEAVRDVGDRIDPALLRVDGEAIEYPSGLLVMLHKPVGYVCSHGSAEGPTVYDLLPERWMSRLPPPASVGRLDKDTSGLLLITDDGDLIHRWTSPKRGAPKVYEARVGTEPQAGAEALFASGEWLLEGEPKACRPATLERVGPGHVRVTVTEGKYHQVRRMLAGVGAEVLALHRVRFGDYELGDLAVGSWRALERPEQPSRGVK